MQEWLRHWCIEQSFGLCGRRRGWDDLGEWHWNMYNIIYETSRQSGFDARYWMLGAGALGRPRGMVWGGRREEGGGFRMGNTCIPVADSCWYMAKPIQYCKVKKLKKKKKECRISRRGSREQSTVVAYLQAELRWNLSSLKVKPHSIPAAIAYLFTSTW